MSIEIRIGKARHHMAMVRELATKVYDPKDVSPLAKYLELFDRCPEGFIFAFDTDTNRLVGYIISLPLEQEYFPRTTEMDYTEGDLTPEVVKQYTKGNNYVYLFSIVSNRNHPKRLEILRSLSRAYVSQLRDMARDGKYVLEASAIALSESGIKICQGMNMEEKGVNPKGTVFHSEKFHKLYIDSDTKQDIIRNFIINKRNRKATPQTTEPSLPSVLASEN